MADKNFRVRHGLEVDGPATVAGTVTADGADIGNITVAVTDDNTITTTSGDLKITAVAGSAVTITSETTSPTVISRNTNSTNVSVRSLSLDVQSSGTPAVGFGNSLEWQVEAQAGNTERAGFIAVSSTDLTPGSEDFSMNFGLMENGAAFTTKMSLDSTGSLDIDNNLTVGGTTVDLAQGTTIEYSENNNRLNRPVVKSTTGNTSGLRVEAPNATSSAVAIVAPFSTNDPDNGKFINIRADGSAGPLSIRTGQYVAGVFGASGNSIDIYDGSTKYATINPAGPTVGTDLTTKTYVDAHPGTTYNIDATSATGGANLNLNGSDLSIDTVKFANGSNVTITQTSANEITIAATDTNTTYTIDAASTTGGANFNLVGSDSTTDTIKFSGSGATTVTQTSVNEITVSSTDTNTTYTIDASSTTGGANLNLVGSDSTTDTVKFASGTGVTVSQTSVNEMSIAIGQAVGTGDSPSFAGVTGGNISVGVATDNTIASTDTNGNIILAPNGTGDVQVDADTLRVGDSNATATITTNGTGNLVMNTNGGTNAGSITLAQGTNGNITLTPNGTGVVIFDSIQRLRGESQATTNNSYTFPPPKLTTVTDNNGYSAASSFGTTGSGYGANAQYVHYTGDTAAGLNAVPALNFRQAQGNSVAGQNIPWLGTNSVAASASQSGDVLGTTNYNGYGTTGFINDIATEYQGGGLGTTHGIQVQAYAAEAFADGTKTLSSSDITAVASSFRSALGAPSVTGTKGQISFNSTTPGIGQAIRVTGTLTGTATGITTGTDYWIIATNGTTTATLSATPNGPPIDTTAGTLTGLTLTRCGVTFTIANQTSYPFGRNALVTIANVTNLADGTYPVGGAVTSLTSILLGVPHTVAPTLPGTQTFSCPTVTAAGAGYRIRANPLSTPMNPQNRLNLIDHTAAAATFRSNAFTFAGGAYAGTGATFATLDANEFKPSVPVRYATTAAGNFAGGSTYTPAATITNGVSATINTGTGGFTIALTNLLSSGESGHYQFYVNNTSGNNQTVTTTGGVVNANHNLTAGSSMMITVYIVDTAAFCEHIA